MFKKTIIAEFFTTVSFNQALQSLYLMTFGSYKLRYGKENKLFEQEFLEKITGQSQIKTGYPQGAPLQNNSKIISFYNGRNAIYHALKIIGVEKNDEIIVSSYTCSVVVNAVIQTNSKIIYSDIENETLSFDFEVLKKNITESTKVIILQHTFGKQARDYEEIINFCKNNDILVIEDCAHSLGNHPQPLLDKEGRIGDFLIFSTGRDKVISSITGGFLVINKKVGIAGMHSLQDELKMPSIKIIYKNLMYNLVGYKAY
ncbi:MAG: DegT/DnrJ/EryC1/StrS family aminotransferase, partial [Candidatus Gracilibacteria bacterium]|nr:DegT/DnrJ/EryC1/StrS family aminotransferase [Candidatus Gracilibacteria bacterium]